MKTKFTILGYDCTITFSMRTDDLGTLCLYARNYISADILYEKIVRLWNIMVLINSHV